MPWVYYQATGKLFFRNFREIIYEHLREIEVALLEGRLRHASPRKLLTPFDPIPGLTPIQREFLTLVRREIVKQAPNPKFVDTKYVATGYSGHGPHYKDGKNNPFKQALRDIGPIPAGRWTIKKPAHHVDGKGPCVMNLQPALGTNVFGRDGFLIHGDSGDHPGMASIGCIILDFPTRTKIASSPDGELLVVGLLGDFEINHAAQHIA